MPSHEDLLQEFQLFARSAASVESLMERISERLHQELARYNWVGFYLLDPRDSNFLVVGPFAGSFTPNARIPFDRGLCGACATSGKTIVVHDVTNDYRYLPGTDMVKSEIVAPIFKKTKFVAEIDVESYFANTFPPADQKFVEAIAALVGKYMEGAKP
ncbi:MAG: GAF domain-containing protein [Acidobacteriia bacterium]|nr:GAF domain-containing protein [Terriglobia bacterium]